MGLAVITPHLVASHGTFNILFGNLADTFIQSICDLISDQMYGIPDQVGVIYRILLLVGPFVLQVFFIIGWLLSGQRACKVGLGRGF